MGIIDGLMGKSPEQVGDKLLDIAKEKRGVVTFTEAKEGLGLSLENLNKGVDYLCKNNQCELRDPNTMIMPAYLPGSAEIEAFARERKGKLYADELAQHLGTNTAVAEAALRPLVHAGTANKDDATGQYIFPVLVQRFMGLEPQVKELVKTKGDVLTIDQVQEALAVDWDACKETLEDMAKKGFAKRMRRPANAYQIQVEPDLIRTFSDALELTPGDNAQAIEPSMVYSKINDWLTITKECELGTECTIDELQTSYKCTFAAERTVRNETGATVRVKAGVNLQAQRMDDGTPVSTKVVVTVSSVDPGSARKLMDELKAFVLSIPETGI